MSLNEKVSNIKIKFFWSRNRILEWTENFFASFVKKIEAIPLTQSTNPMEYHTYKALMTPTKLKYVMFGPYAV